MRYLCLLVGEPDVEVPVPGTPEFMQMLSDYESATRAMAAAGVLVDSGPLPSDPSGWLITVAKNHAVDRLRREAPPLRQGAGRDAAPGPFRSPSPAGMVVDDRLRLIFACCHPALDPGTRVALTLRTTSTPRWARGSPPRTPPQAEATAAVTGSGTPLPVRRPGGGRRSAAAIRRSGRR